MLRLEKIWDGGIAFDKISASTDGVTTLISMFPIPTLGEPVKVSEGDKPKLGPEVFDPPESADNYIVSDWECNDVAESTVTQGGNLEIFSGDVGHMITCTVTNTFVFFEGIPVLNRYGLALLVLLMLGIGVIGFRRFS